MSNELPVVEKLRQLVVLPVEKLTEFLRNDQTKDLRNLGLSSSNNDGNSFFLLKDVTVAPLPALRQDMKDLDTYHRVYITRNNNTSLYEEEVGWVINEDITRCMICQSLFNQSLLGTNGKHHCRACGNIICAQCSSDTAIVAGLSETIEVRVCRVCYWGQTPVQRMNSRKLGKSILVEEQMIIMHETAKTPPVEEKRTVNFDCIPFEYDIKPEKEVKKYVKELHSLIPHIRTKKYGQTELLPVTKIFTLKLFYFASKNQENMTSSKRKRASVAMPNADGLLLADPDEVLSYLKVNICTSDRVAGPCKATHDIINHEQVSTLIPIVFNQLARKERSIEVLDIAINDKILEQMEFDENLPKKFLEEIFVGASILYPDFIFSHSEKETSDSPNSSDTTRSALTMSLPPLEASQKLRFVFTSVTEMILSARSCSSGEDSPTNPGSIEDRFFKFLTEVHARYRVTPRPTKRNSKTLEETLSQKTEITKLQPHHLKISDDTEEERERESHVQSEEKDDKENIDPIYDDTSTIITQSEYSGLGQKYSSKLPSLRINTTLSRTSSFSSTLSILRSEDGFTSPAHSNSTRSLRSPSSLATPQYNSFNAGKTPMQRQKSMQPSAWTFLAHSIGVSHSGVAIPKPKKGERKSLVPPILLNQNNDGKKFLTPHCLDVIKEVSVDIITNDHLKSMAKQNPKILLGWQVIIMNEDMSSMKGLYVITGVKTSLLYGKMFRISSFDEDDQWIKLKLLEHGKGYTFQLFRKVVDINKSKQSS